MNGPAPLVNLDIIGKRPESIVPNAVWIDIQPQPASNIAVQNAIYEEQRLVRINLEKSMKLKNFQKNVQRRVSSLTDAKRNQAKMMTNENLFYEREALHRSALAAEHGSPVKNRCSYNVNPIGIDGLGNIMVPSAITQHKLVSSNPSSTAAVDVLGTCVSKSENSLQNAHSKMTSLLKGHATNPASTLHESLPGGAWNDDNVQTIQAVHDADEIAVASIQDAIVPALMDSLGEKNVVLSQSQKSAHEKSALSQSMDKLARNVNFKSTDFEDDFDDKENNDREEPTQITRKLCRKQTNIPEINPGRLAEKQRRATEKTRWMSRRVFADAERKRAREVARMRDHQAHVERLRANKEQEREKIEEECVDAIELSSAISRAKEQQRVQEKKLEERRQEKFEKKHQAAERFATALKATIQEKIEQSGIELPPLCMCSESFWDSDPMHCANNCIFYKNQSAFAKALETVLRIVEKNTANQHDVLQKYTVSLPLNGMDTERL